MEADSRTTRGVVGDAGSRTTAGLIWVLTIPFAVIYSKVLTAKEYLQSMITARRY